MSIILPDVPKHICRTRNPTTNICVCVLEHLCLSLMMLMLMVSRPVRRIAQQTLSYVGCLGSWQTAREGPLCPVCPSACTHHPHPCSWSRADRNTTLPRNPQNWTETSRTLESGYVVIWNSRSLFRTILEPSISPLTVHNFRSRFRNREQLFRIVESCWKFQSHENII